MLRNDPKTLETTFLHVFDRRELMPDVTGTICGIFGENSAALVVRESDFSSFWSCLRTMALVISDMTGPQKPSRPDL